MKTRCLAWFFGFLLVAGLASPRAYGAKVLQVDLDSVIHPLTVEIVTEAIEQADAENYDAVVLRLDTPGGLLGATQEINQQILSSPVPVITFVGPSGGRAASAGFMILIAADIAAMAPATNTGAASPVAAGGQEIEPTMKAKVENDAAAAVRSVAEKRGRNVELAEKAVLEAASYTEEEALDANLIDLVAADVPELLSKLDGRTIERFDGDELTLSLKGAAVEPFELSSRQELLAVLVDPNVSFIILLLGALGLYIEFNNPGLIVPGVVGGILFVLGLMAISVLPINWAGAALIVGGLVCLILEATVTSGGILAIGGSVAMILGAVMLIDTEVPALQINLETAIAAVLPFAVITVFLLRLAITAFRSKVATGAEAMVGLTAVAKTEIAHTGRVFLNGELWNARAAAPIAEGERVRVVAVEGLELTVETAD